MKKLSIIFAILTATALFAETIRTEEKNFRGHLQGFAIDETGIYCSFANDMLKTDLKGKTIRKFSTCSHAGDMTTDGKNIYCAVTIWDKKIAEKYGAHNCVFIYDKELNLLEVKPFKELNGFDGIAFLDGKFYIGLNDLSNKLRMENRIAIFDKNWKLLKISSVTIGCQTRYGAQNLKAYRGKLLAGFYGGGDAAFIFDPAELLNSDKTVKPEGTFPTQTSTGFAELPAELSTEPDSVIIARSTSTRDKATGKKKFGARFLVQRINGKGVLKHTNIKPAGK